MRTKTMLASLALAAVVASAALAGYSSADYAYVLSRYVGGGGLVDYEGLRSDRSRLDAYLAGAAALRTEEYEGWSDEEKTAFWINVYNARTMQTIIDHYPAKSIRGIKGAWDKMTFTVMGKELTLDQVEHEILRKRFHEPRIHMALVCAAVSCPPLRAEPYSGDRLDEQLEDQSRIFLDDPSRFHIDAKRGVVLVSSILDWYGGDFVDAYGGKKEFKGYGRVEGAVLAFISSHLDAERRALLASRKWKIEYAHYDWSLNSRRRKVE